MRRSGQTDSKYPGRAGIPGARGVSDEAASSKLQYPLQLQQSALETQDPQGALQSQRADLRRRHGAPDLLPDCGRHLLPSVYEVSSQKLVVKIQ